MPNWLYFVLGIIATHVAYAVVFAVIWYRVILQEPETPKPQTSVDEVIVREIGTLTIYGRRN